MPDGPGTEPGSGEWGRPGIGFACNRNGAFERDEESTALAESYAEAFARRRQNDAELVHLASVSLEITEATASAGIGARIAARRADRDVADSIAEIGLISIHEALHICRVARGITERTTLLGEQLPAPYERVREAFENLNIPVDSASAIISALDEAGSRAGALANNTANNLAHNLAHTDAETRENFAVAEKLLVEFAQQNPADQVRKLAARWRDALDVDGVEPREKALTQLTSLHRFVRANGMKRYVLDADPVAAAYLDAVIDGYVGATIRRPRFDGPGSDGPGSDGPGSDGIENDAATSDAALNDACGRDAFVEVLEDTRSLGQIAAESIVQLARHGIACTNTEIPVRATSIVVRMSLEQLITGLGAAYIDGIETPISAGTARIMAADAEIIPEVLGGDSEVLDLGTRRRLFSRAQRLAITERDGGCAFPGCEAPPTHTEAHHIEWWTEGGLTNLDNAITVCSRHHHTVHRDRWGIRVIDNVPWFVPPSSIDATLTPRRGGKLPDPRLPNPARGNDWSLSR
ncbi:HNH endonuclease signature motif containing protein [Frigoribacterium sp. CG_9.8]|uniref:HNH endonuclease signature motif containing protein n=1 Tax=Frigoribacterium sp. CG_9.8 TaxID=2787733 RepID=UPI0018C9E818|nr:hypothetical protein [Frigoribacterium sp. CG_9.8]